MVLAGGLASKHWRGNGLATLEDLHASLLPGQEAVLHLGAEDLDFVALRFDGPHGLARYIGRALGRQMPQGPDSQISGSVIMWYPLIGGRGDIKIAFILKESVARIDDFPRFVAAAVRPVLGATKLSWRLQISRLVPTPSPH